MNVTLLEDFAALACRRDAWNALVARAQTSTVFQTYEMHASWWKVFGGDGRLCALAAEEDGRLLGIAPLMRTRQRVLQLIGTRMFDYNDLIVDRDRADVASALLNEIAVRAQFDLLFLRDVPDSSPTLSALDALRRNGHFVDTRVLYAAPTRLFNDPAADRELPNKKSLRRHHNYFHSRGRLAFKHCENASQVGEYLDDFFDQHVQRRAATNTPSLFVDERMRDFFREMVRTLPPEWLRFSVVLFNDAPIAMHFGFEYGGRLIWYKPAFAMAYAKYSPGEVLVKYLLEYALERKLCEFDFTIGDEAFKYRFANHTRHNYAVRVYRHWAPYRVNRLILDVRAAVERHPALAQVAHRLLRRWRDRPWL